MRGVKLRRCGKRYVCVTFEWKAEEVYLFNVFVLEVFRVEFESKDEINNELD